MKKFRINLKNVSGMATVVACFAVSMMLFSGCTPEEKEKPGNPDNPGITIAKASVEYLNREQNAIIIITFDNYGKRFRQDYLSFNTSGNLEDYDAFIVDHNQKTLYLYTSNSWRDLSYEEAMRDNDTEMMYPDAYVIDEATLSSADKLPNETIAGKTCKVFKYKEGKNNVKLALWSGLIMSLEMNNVEVLKALAATLTVPASAFTKTTDVSWIDSELGDIAGGTGTGGGGGGGGGDNPSGTRLVSSVYYFESIESGAATYNYEYDSQNRISKITVTGGSQLNRGVWTVTYPSSNTIKYNNPEKYYFDLTKNSQGYVSKYEGNITGTMTKEDHEYENGYLTKSTVTKEMPFVGNLITNITLTWNNGKLDVIENITSGSVNHFKKFTYSYTTIPYKECSVTPWHQRDVFIPPYLSGKISPNLVSSVKEEDSVLGTTTTTYRYETDANGYVTKVHAKINAETEYLLYDVKYK